VTRSQASGAPSARTRIRRISENARYERATIDAILDEALVAHLGFVHDGQPYVIPTLHARVGDVVYVHGSAASRTLRALACGAPVCLTVTLLDGLVLARSVFEHSVNYRSVVVLGTATLVVDQDEKLVALEAFSEQLVPGRWADVRQPSGRELKATSILSLPLDEASAKVRTRPPDDGDSPDAELDVWAGVVPLELRALAPVPAPDLRPGIPVPRCVNPYTRT
jgi:nitroimidazol reductase NimA-like FMN-containing flavoprotein (pyridoxamine 5'-phosphate oxidase superfamily)